MGYIKIPADRDQAMVFMEGNINWDNPESALGVLQEEVGGYVERVRIGDYRARRGFPDVIMLVDEEGKLKGKETNRRASYLYGTLVHSQLIAGDVVIIGEKLDPMEGAVWCDLPSNWTIENLDSYLANHDTSWL